MLTIRARAQADELAGIRRALLAYCASLDLSDRLASAVVVAANEACTAAIQQANTDVERALELHAWIGQPGFLHADPSAPVEPGAAADAALYVSLRDESHAAPSSTRADALGARFMRALADRVHRIDHGRSGTEIILEFRLGTMPA